MSGELVKMEPGELMPVEPVRRTLSVAEMLQGAIERGLTNDNAEALEKIAALYERMQAVEAEKNFAAAFIALQSEMPKVRATRVVPGNDGGVRYRFAPFEDIMAQVGPMLQKHGFSVSFSNRYDGARLIETCTLQHAGGHKRTNDFAVRIGSGPPKASEAQADGAASTYAKRFALCNALNIVIVGIDNDARAEGAPITAMQAASLRTRVEATGSDEAMFLKFAGATTYEAIPASKYAMLDATLKRKETTR